MRRAILALALGLVGATVTYGWFYRSGTAASRAMLRSPKPELAWLEREFKLSDTERERVSHLHALYLPGCKDRCRRVQSLNSKLFDALAMVNAVTPEIETLLKERAELRVACHTAMIEHFFTVSRTMPPEQGKRYLAWVWNRTCLRERAMDHDDDHPMAASSPTHKP